MKTLKQYLPLTVLHALSTVLLLSCAPSFRSALEVRTPLAPVRFDLDGVPSIYYELHLTNQSLHQTKLEHLGITLNTASRSGWSFDRQELKRRCLKIDGAIDSSLTLAPGTSLVVYLELSEQLLSEANQLNHEISIVVNQNGRWVNDVFPFALQLDSQQAKRLGPPLAGSNWVGVYSPEWNRGHRRVIYTREGKPRIPGRFAIDFIKVDQNGLFAPGNDDSISNWFGYAQPVLAVADGVVSSVRADFTESPLISTHPRYNAEEATGNYVSIKTEDHVFAFYEHLKPGSIRVIPGQKILRGDTIASLGFTGQTTGPHLHFHLADRDSPLGAEGIPFVFDHFTEVGHYETLDDFGKRRWQFQEPKPLLRNGERPHPNSVIGFR